jgi:protein tyrosine phosphatase (PTP) superfamily phosphohydrolase (DUF442 family)
MHPHHPILNFRLVSPLLATAGQPTAEQFRAIAADGCRAVVNLHVNDPRWALSEEESLLAELGMAYHHVPVFFDAPTAEDHARFRDVMQSLAGVPTLVHCVLNYRVSVFTALYGEQCLGWSREQADALVADVWQPDGAWPAFIARMRGGA